ncbi:MAG: sensor histidine kinase [Bacteroidales bacterium]
MLNNFQRYLLTWHPFLISIILFLAVVIFFPFEWNEYRVKQDQVSNVDSQKLSVYKDLNNDGIADKIEFLNFKNPKISSIRVATDKGILDQWNFKGHISKKKLTYFIGDYDGNALEEIYFFTLRNDSILLNIIEPYSKQRSIVVDRFITQYKTANTGAPDCNIHEGGITDLDNDNKKELYFGITAGYNKQPRRVFIYDIENDSLKVSDKAGISIFQISHFYPDGSSKPLLTGNINAHGNHDSDFPFTDQKGWLMVFDNNLDFWFDPISFDEYPMKLYVEPFENKGNTYLFVHKNYWGVKDIQCGLYIFNLKGEVEKERMLKRKYHSKNSSILTIKNQLYAISGEGSVHKLNFDLETVAKWEIDGMISGKPVFKGDMNDDGHNEYIFKGENNGEYLIVNKELRHPVSINIPCDKLTNPHFNVVKNNEGETLLYAESDQRRSFYTYRKNKFYNFRYFVYVLLFCLLWLFVWLFSQLQNRLVRQKYEMQQKISELQLKSIKNHIEPHFTFNLLNSISALLHKGDNDKANEMIGKYSKLLRQSVVNSDKTIVPLSEEINYVRHYLEIERYRYNYKFDYTIDIRDEADLNITVPKMFLQIFVENAVRHGIKHLTNNGLIKILVAKVQSTYQIEILDNGIGREKAAEYSANSTKSGLSSIEKIRKYHNQHTKNQKITYEIRDLKEGEENPGTHVIIKIKRYGRKKNFTG